MQLFTQDFEEVAEIEEARIAPSPKLEDSSKGADIPTITHDEPLKQRAVTSAPASPSEEHTAQPAPAAKSTHMLPPQKRIDVASLTHFTRHYEVIWKGLHVADVFVELSPVRHRVAQNVQYFYRLRTLVRTVGIVDMAVGYQNHATGFTRLEGEDKARDFDLELHPSRFATFSIRRGKRRDIEMHYHDNNNIKSESNNPPERVEKRPKVKEAFKHGVYDPMTATLQARKDIYHILSQYRPEIERLKRRKSGRVAIGERLVVPFYNVRRRADVRINIRNAFYDEETQQVLLSLQLRERPVDGYTQKEMKKYEERDAVIELHLDATYLLPVYAKGDSPLGEARIVLERECQNFDQCIKIE